MVIDNNLKNILYDNGVFDAWQYFVNVQKTIETSEFCLKMIDSTLENIHQQHSEWQNKVADELFSQDSPVKQWTLTSSNMPKYMTSFQGVDFSTYFLLNKLIKDFFQYSRNVFDGMAQISNVALLCFYSKKPDSVDFPCMCKTFNQTTYSAEFPKTKNWYNNVSTSCSFKYIDAFNNRIKHTCDIYIKFSLSMLSDDHSEIINPFFRKDDQHSQHDVSTYLTTILDYIKGEFDNFSSIILEECAAKKYQINQYNRLCGFQQHRKNDPTANNVNTDFALVYIETNDSIENMPDEIRVLLLNKSAEGEIFYKNCSFDKILVNKDGVDYNYIGEYVAEEPCGDDTLIKYRKYKKHTVEHPEVFFVQAMTDWQNNPNKTFFKVNPFISFKTVSDDENFMKMIQLPF